MNKHTHSVTIFVTAFPPLSAEATEIEDIFKKDRKIKYRQVRRSPVSITYLTTMDPSDVLDPHISDNLSCIDSFQVYKLDETSPTPSISCKVYYSFLSIKIPSFATHLVDTQIQAKKIAPMERKKTEASAPNPRPTTFRKVLSNWPRRQARAR